MVPDTVGNPYSTTQVGETSQAFSGGRGTVFGVVRDLRQTSTIANRWDQKVGLRRDAIGSQVIDALEGARDTRHKGDRQ